MKQRKGKEVQTLDKKRGSCRGFRVQEKWLKATRKKKSNSVIKSGMQIVIWDIGEIFSVFLQKNIEH